MSLKIDDDVNKTPFIDMGGGYQIRLEKEPLTEFCQKKAEKELRETPENVKLGKTELKELIIEEIIDGGFVLGDLATLTDEDEEEFLMKFLRPCKFYSKSAFERMKNYYKFRVKHKKICQNLFPETVRHVFEQQVIKLQPRRDQHGARLIILDVGKTWKPSKCPLDDLFRAVQIGLEAGMIEPMTQVNGCTVILDMDGLSLTHVMQFTPSFACMILEWIQDCIALRVKAVHVVNNSYLFNMIFTIFKPFIREKLRKRIFFHNKDWKSLTSHVDKECLRPKYGGTMKVDEVNGTQIYELLKLYNHDYERANNVGYFNEKK